MAIVLSRRIGFDLVASSRTDSRRCGLDSYLLHVQAPENTEHRAQEFQKQRWANYRNGRERPHFCGFQPPKKFFGVAPARWFRRATSHSSDAPPAGLPLTYSVPANDTATRFCTNLVTGPERRAHGKEKDRNANSESATQTHSKRNDSGPRRGGSRSQITKVC